MKTSKLFKTLLFTLSLSLLFTACKDGKQEDEPNKPKPIQVYEKDGVTVNAYDFAGLEYFLNKDDNTTYVVNFWATWCVPCVEEMPYFEKLGEEYKDDNVKVLLVSLDMPKMVETKLLPFIKEKDIKSEVVLLRDPDANSWISKVSPEWSGAIPATVIYKKDKKSFYEQSFNYEQLVTALDSIK